MSENIDPFDDSFNNGLMKIQDGIEVLEKLKNKFPDGRQKAVRTQIASLNQVVRDLTAIIKKFEA